MAKPRNIDDRQLIHFGRYLRGKKRVFNKYGYQKNCNIIDVWSDTDHMMRMSTTGGAIMFGSNVIKHWSSTQSLIDSSSGETEDNGCVSVSVQGRMC